MVNVLVNVRGESAACKSTVLNDITNALVAKGYKVNTTGEHVVVVTGEAICAKHIPCPYDERDVVNIQQNISTTKPKSALEEAMEVIYGDREKTYGDPGKNLRIIAEYWTTHLKAAKSFDGVLTTDDVCVMMVLLKQARLANSPKHRDSIVDTIGYSALADRINSDFMKNSQ